MKVVVIRQLGEHAPVVSAVANLYDLMIATPDYQAALAKHGPDMETATPYFRDLAVLVAREFAGEHVSKLKEGFVEYAGSNCKFHYQIILESINPWTLEHPILIN